MILFWSSFSALLMGMLCSVERDVMTWSLRVFSAQIKVQVWAHGEVNSMDSIYH